MSKVTVQLVSVTNIPASSMSAGEVPEHALIGQLLTREDGAKRLITMGFNEDGDSDEEIIDNSPDEVVPALMIQLGVYQLVDAALIDGADIRVLAELPSFDTEDEAA